MGQNTHVSNGTVALIVIVALAFGIGLAAPASAHIGTTGECHGLVYDISNSHWHVCYGSAAQDSEPIQAL